LRNCPGFVPSCIHLELFPTGTDSATLVLERYPEQGECGSQSAAANRNLSSGKLRPENAKARHVLAFIFLVPENHPEEKPAGVT
jgi:hypothetical protein